VHEAGVLSVRCRDSGSADPFEHLQADAAAPAVLARLPATAVSSSHRPSRGYAFAREITPVPGRSVEAGTERRSSLCVIAPYSADPVGE
jgi:hypothetical protein